MEDLKLMTVRALRELARSRLGPGYSKLKTKAELIAALAKKLAAEAKKAEPKKVEAKKPEPKKLEPKKPPEKLSETKKPEAKKAEPAKFEAKKPEASSAAPEAPKFEPGAPAKASKPGDKPVDLAALRLGATEPEPEAEGATEPEPAPETPAAQAPPRKMSPAEIDLLNEHLGELPYGYGDDSVGLLARDPHTLWVYWDFAEQTARRAHEGVPHARAVLRLFDGGQLVREVDVALESRSWYLHHVTPGRRYRAEIQFVGSQGQARRVGPASNTTRVPTEGPSPVVDDRFIKLPWDVPFQRSAELLEHAHAGAPFPESERAALLARAEHGLHQEGLRDATPGEVELYHEVVRGLGGSDTMVELMRRRAHFGGQWTSSRPAAAWTSSRPG